MTGLATLGLMGAICLIAFVIVWAAVRASARAGAAEANEEAAVRQTEILKQSEKVKDETLARMADAGAASVSRTASDARERMRKRSPTTR